MKLCLTKSRKSKLVLTGIHMVTLVNDAIPASDFIRHLIRRHGVSAVQVENDGCYGETEPLTAMVLSWRSASCA
jgi:hypothetical protein